MNCEHARTRVLDHLDDLLDAADAQAMEAHFLACASCRDARDRAARQHALVLAPYPVAAPSLDLPSRVLLRHRQRSRRVPAWAGYAASFAAGVLVTFLLHLPATSPPPPDNVRPVAVQPSPEPSPDTPAPHLRRIR